MIFCVENNIARIGGETGLVENLFERRPGPFGSANASWCHGWL
jgi:hypothetical protein